MAPLLLVEIEFFGYFFPKVLHFSTQKDPSDGCYNTQQFFGWWVLKTVFGALFRDFPSDGCYRLNRAPFSLVKSTFPLFPKIFPQF